MNTQIKELVKKSGTDSSGKWMSIDNAEKFAELIVRECMSELYIHGYDDARTQIKQYFGVED